MPNATFLTYIFINSVINDFDNYPLNISNYKGRSTTGEGVIREWGASQSQRELTAGYVGAREMREWENEKMKIASLFNFAQVWNFGKVWDEKVIYWDC